MKTIATLALALLFLFLGCSVRTLTAPDGSVVYKSVRFGNKEAIKRVEYRDAKGQVFILEGYASDQAEGMGIIAEAAARGAVQGITGKPPIPEGFKLAPKDDPSVPRLEIEQ